MRVAIFGALFLFVASGCAADPPAPSVMQISIMTSGGPKLFTVELASDPQSQERGLMYRRQLAPDSGMLFVFPKEANLAFWMKNTLLSLDMLFIRSDGSISTIEPNTVPLSTSPIASTEPVLAVLELNAGRAHVLGIRPGDRVHARFFHNAN